MLIIHFWQVCSISIPSAKYDSSVNCDGLRYPVLAQLPVKHTSSLVQSIS